MEFEKKETKFSKINSQYEFNPYTDEVTTLSTELKPVVSITQKIDEYLNMCKYSFFNSKTDDPDILRYLKFETEYYKPISDLLSLFNDEDAEYIINTRALLEEYKNKIKKGESLNCLYDFFITLFQPQYASELLLMFPPILGFQRNNNYINIDKEALKIIKKNIYKKRGLLSDTFRIKANQEILRRFVSEASSRVYLYGIYEYNCYLKESDPPIIFDIISKAYISQNVRHFKYEV